jgi:NADH:ubiquinone oxidoreductase subunit F (NADH-binding)
MQCREGTKQLLEILEDITKERGSEEDITLLEEMGKAIIADSICGLGRISPNPPHYTPAHEYGWY